MDIPEWVAYALNIYLKTLGAFFLFGAALWFFLPKVLPLQFESDGREQPRTELAYSLFNLALWAGASALIVFSYFTIGRPVISDSSDPEGVHPLYYPFWFIFVLLAVDAMFYAVHRSLHAPGVYRLAHATHHRFTSPTPWGGYSFHVVEGLLLSLFTVFLPYFMMPFNMWVGAAFNSFAVAWAVFLHSGFRSESWATHPVLRFIYSPSHHRLHHQMGQHNYALYFTFWDKIFGTEAVPAAEK